MTIFIFTWFKDNLAPDNLAQDNMQSICKSCWQLHKIHYRCWQLIKVIKIDTSKYKTFIKHTCTFHQNIAKLSKVFKCRILNLIIQSSLCMDKTFTFLKPINIIHPTQSHPSHFRIYPSPVRTFRNLFLVQKYWCV